MQSIDAAKLNGSVHEVTHFSLISTLFRTVERQNQPRRVSPVEIGADC